MKNIVVGFDGSEAAKRALTRAAELANGATVTVVSAVAIHVPTGRGGMAAVDPEERTERERELTEAAALLREKGITPREVEGHGDPGDVIIEEARELGADLIVVGTRGLNAAERLVLGSVSTKVVHHAPCDVLVVR